MQEILEQVVDYLKGIWLKRRYIIVSTWLLCPLGWLFVASLDDIYQSEARVYADTKSILGPLLKGITVDSDPSYQIRLMVSTLLSRPNLERIARMTDLDVQAVDDKQYEALIERLKEQIQIKKTGGRGDNIYTISFEHKDPTIAKNVVQSSLNVFIENTLGENRVDADSAQKFLDEQIEEYESRLLAAEARLTEFKQKYSGILPKDAGGYYAELRAEKDRLETAELELREVETSLNSAKAQLSSSSTDPQQLSENIKGTSSISTSFDERIAQLESNLDNLLLRYTERHPDVVEAKRLLTSLQEARSKELEAYFKALANTDDDANNLSPIAANPVYQEIRIKVNDLENQAASLRVRVSNYKAKVKDLENKIHVIPEIEAELVGLNRGYDITRKKYEELLNRKEVATIAQQADETANKINFRVIDPPRVPNKPTGPKRNLFFFAVLVVAFGTGIGLSLLFSQINPVVTSASQITKETGIPVFGIVSAASHLGLQKWHRRKTYIFVASNVVILMMMLALIVYFTFPVAIQNTVRGFL